MADGPQPPRSKPVNGGRYVSRYEWEMHIRWGEAGLMERKADQEAMARRVDRLEQRWDRLGGPIVALIAAMGLLATGASIVSAIVIIGTRA